MNMRKILIILFIIVLLTMSFVGCKNTTEEVAVQGIAINFSTLKDCYQVGEAFDTSTEIIVTYEDGTIASVSVTTSMLVGFSTATVGYDLVCTIVYGGQSVDMVYDVIEVGSADNSDVTFNMTYTKDSDVATINIALTNIDSECVIYGISCEVYLTGLSIVNVDINAPSDFQVLSTSYDSAIMIVCYAKDGNVELQNGDFYITLTANITTTDTARVKLQNCKVSDKVSDTTITSSTNTIYII